jgi:hypothetical protein
MIFEPSELDGWFQVAEYKVNTHFGRLVVSQPREDKGDDTTAGKSTKSKPPMTPSNLLHQQTRPRIIKWIQPEAKVLKRG